MQDVAQVGIGSSFRTGAATVNGEESVVGGALMLAGGNSRIVARDVAEKLAQIQEKLPPGVEIRPLYNRSDLVNRTLRTVETNLFEGALLVVVVLFACSAICGPRSSSRWRFRFRCSLPSPAWSRAGCPAT